MAGQSKALGVRCRVCNGPARRQLGGRGSYVRPHLAEAHVNLAWREGCGPQYCTSASVQETVTREGVQWCDCDVHSRGDGIAERTVLILFIQTMCVSVDYNFGHMRHNSADRGSRLTSGCHGCTSLSHTHDLRLSCKSIFSGSCSHQNNLSICTRC